MSNIRPLKKWNFNLDEADVELPDRSAFYFPNQEGNDKTYLCGHSLGLQPATSATYVEQVMDQWKTLAVDGHFRGESPWIEYLDKMHDMMAHLVNAKANEVVIMNSLTVNIHMLLSGFFRPNSKRRKIVIDFPTFPSDVYAVRSHLEVRGYSEEDIIPWSPDPSDGIFKVSDLEDIIDRHKDEIDLVFLSGLHYLNGQFFNIASISRAVHQYPIKLGLDLAHAVGNVELFLHDWDVDFAVWCTYKYLNGGPGSLGACFIHEKHHENDLHFQGWWGNSMTNRFEMLSHFTPDKGALSWQLSNPTILSLAPLRASLELYEKFGMQKLRAKSKMLSTYLYDELNSIPDRTFRITTPENVNERGAMLCLKFEELGREIFQQLSNRQIVVDFRRPDTIRVAPHPLYNNFSDCYHFVSTLEVAMNDIT